jgi:zinc protease
VKPLPGENPTVKVPDFWSEQFANGLKLIGVRNTEIPSVTLQLSVEAGHYLEGLDKSKAGIAQLTADLLDEATEKHTAEELNLELEKLGSSIEISSDKNYITVTISSLLKNLDKTLQIAEEKLFHPKFDAPDFERLKKQQLEAIANQITQPVTIANNIYNKLLYGPDHIMAIPALGTEASVKSLTLEDVKAYYSRYFSPTISSLVAVGDIEKTDLLPKIGFLKTWAAKDVKLPVFAESPKIDKTRIYLVDKENAPQSEIRIGYMSMPYDATGEYYKSTLMNFVLGGAFNSRINMNLREDKGFTYGARSWFSGDKHPGPFTASAGVRANATDSSVVEFLKELKTYQGRGITDEELVFTKNSIGQNDALKYETPVQKAAFLKRIIVYNLDRDFVNKQNQILKNITKEEINSLAKKNLAVDNMVIIVVGDRKNIRPGLEKLGYEIIELDKDGNKILN